MNHLKKTTICSLTILAFTFLTATAWAQHFQQFSFQKANGSDPRGGVIADAAGNFYGTTYTGGADNLGVVYEISPTVDGKVTQTVLYSFTGDGLNADGGNPIGELVMDSSGNLYGVTQFGGNGGNQCECGTVFEVSPPSLPGGPWTETILHEFQGSPTDGSTPVAGLILDSAGNLYGTTEGGGEVSPYCPCGTVFELSPPGLQGGAWTETILYVFQGGFDGNEPLGALVFDQAGNLYGTTSLGGEGQAGTIFELTPPAVQGEAWSEIQLHSFTGNVDGAEPQAGLTMASDGSLYGTTLAGGLHGLGTVIGLKPSSVGWHYGVIYSFVNGGEPRGAVTLGNTPNVLYGVTPAGGGKGFQLSASGRTVTYTQIYDFGPGAHPEARLILYKGALYGTSGDGGGNKKGIVFRLSH